MNGGEASDSDTGAMKSESDAVINDGGATPTRCSTTVVQLWCGGKQVGFVENEEMKTMMHLLYRIEMKAEEKEEFFCVFEEDEEEKGMCVVT